MLHFPVYVSHFEGGTIRIDQDPDDRRISEKVKLSHGNKAQGHGIR